MDSLTLDAERARDWSFEAELEFGAAVQLERIAHEAAGFQQR